MNAMLESLLLLCMLAVPLWWWSCACCPCTVDCGSQDVSCCFELAVAGVIDGALCTLCDVYNGTFTLQHDLSCVWVSDETAPVCQAGTSDKVIWSLRYVTVGDYWSLRAGQEEPDITADYRIDNADFDGTGENELTLFFNDNLCDDWPATLTITPIECPEE